MQLANAAFGNNITSKKIKHFDYGGSNSSNIQFCLIVRFQNELSAVVCVLFILIVFYFFLINKEYINGWSGEKLSKVIALFPIGYLSMGTCTTLIMIGGSSCERFFQIVCNPMTCSTTPLTSAEWYLVFTSAAVILSQLPNLNSIAGISLVGAITAVGYCTMIWITSVAEGRIHGVSYNPTLSGSKIQKIFDILNAVGIIAFAFRGHNLVLEIQVQI